MPLPITLMPKAHEHMMRIVEKEKAQGVRLSVSKSGCSGLKYNTNCFHSAQESDRLFEERGLTIAIDKGSLSALEGLCLDYKVLGPGQTQLLYYNPNATDVCGCGESFRLVQKEDRDE